LSGWAGASGLEAGIRLLESLALAFASWSGMRLGWGHDDGAFFFSRPDAAQQECCEPGFTLLCMGLFSRFFVQALPRTAEGTVCRVRDTRSLEHDPEKACPALDAGWVPVFPRDKREAFARRSCSNKKIERDDDSKKSHPALVPRAYGTNRSSSNTSCSRYINRLEARSEQTAQRK
jgi:hypothetical protein